METYNDRIKRKFDDCDEDAADCACLEAGSTFTVRIPFHSEFPRTMDPQLVAYIAAQLDLSPKSVLILQKAANARQLDGNRRNWGRQPHDRVKDHLYFVQQRWMEEQMETLCEWHRLKKDKKPKPISRTPSDSEEDELDVCIAFCCLPAASQSSTETVIRFVMVLGFIGAIMPFICRQAGQTAFCDALDAINDYHVVYGQPQRHENLNLTNHANLEQKFPDVTVSSLIYAQPCLRMTYTLSEQGHCRCGTFIMFIRHCGTQCPYVQPMQAGGNTEWTIPKEIWHFFGRIVLFWCDFTTEQPFHAAGGVPMFVFDVTAILVIYSTYRLTPNNCDPPVCGKMRLYDPSDISYPCSRCRLLACRSAFIGTMLIADALYYAINLFISGQDSIQTYIFFHSGLRAGSAVFFSIVLVGILFLKAIPIYILFYHAKVGLTKCRFKGMPQLHSVELGATDIINEKE